MEEYNKIYPELPKGDSKEAPKEPPKDGNAFRLQRILPGSWRISKKKQNITQVLGKSTKDVTTYCPESAHHQELFRFVSAGLELEQHFLGLACLSPHHLAALVLFAEF